MAKSGSRYVSGAAVLLLTAALCAKPVSAQMFADEQPKPAAVRENNARKPTFNNSWFTNPRSRPAASKADEKSLPKADVQSSKENAQTAPTLQKEPKLKRGYSAIRRLSTGNDDEAEDEQLIFLYYKDFNVTRTMSGMVMCDVKFIVLTTLDQKINNLSFRLKWPGMETSLSYNDVNPNEETYFPYTLVGDGCYTMDKIPNVIVNRCRVKGLSQQQCANKIRWLKR